MITTIKKVKPMFNNMVVTLNKYPTDLKTTGGIIDSTRAGSVKEYQTVVAVGPMVRGIEVGDIVYINPKRYSVMQHKPGSLQDGVIKDNPVVGYKFDIIEIDGVEHMMIQDGDVKFVAEIEEFEENPTIVAGPQLIV